MHRSRLVRAGLALCGAFAGCAYNAGVGPNAGPIGTPYVPDRPRSMGLNDENVPMEASMPPPGYRVGGGPRVQFRRDNHRGTEEPSGTPEQELIRERDDHVLQGDHSHDAQ